ncbi:MAG TPA: CAP domain-containing protein [Acidimicrobiia bacterium]|nr:CAP domain-containing protein [Acidimicrobiia bacterium]
MGAVAAVALLLAACRPQATLTHAQAGCPGSPPDPTIQRLYDRVNSDRAANGLGPLAWNPQLACLAQDHSNYMASTGDFSHRDLSATINQPDYSGYASLGENILVGPSSMSADAMEDAWMNSPGHRANILSTSFDSIGIATATSADGRIWATQNFGRNR